MIEQVSARKGNWELLGNLPSRVEDGRHLFLGINERLEGTARPSAQGPVTPATTGLAPTTFRASRWLKNCQAMRTFSIRVRALPLVVPAQRSIHSEVMAWTLSMPCFWRKRSRCVSRLRFGR